MNVRRVTVLVIVAVLSAAALLTAQSRTRGTTTSRRSPPPQPEPLPAEPGKPGAGAVTPPNQGYVVMPDPAPAGTATGSPIPSDPLDRAYWELYDRQRSITLTGKVTRVDWSNPNSYIYITAASGLWAVESGFIQFRQASVMPAVRVDETITVLGYLPKEEPFGLLPATRFASFTAYLKSNHLIRAGEITTAFGQKLAMGRPPSDAEMAERLKCSPFGC